MNIYSASNQIDNYESMKLSKIINNIECTDAISVVCVFISFFEMENIVFKISFGIQVNP